MKAFIKPFEAPQKRVKKKLIFFFRQLPEIHRAERVKINFYPFK